MTCQHDEVMNLHEFITLLFTTTCRIIRMVTFVYYYFLSVGFGLLTFYLPKKKFWIGDGHWMGHRSAHDDFRIYRYGIYVLCRLQCIKATEETPQPTLF